MREMTEEYSPEWAPHVKGRHEPRVVDEDGMPEEQRLAATCTLCGQTFQRTCSSGMVRQHIARFAKLHLHKDPWEVERKGSNT